MVNEKTTKQETQTNAYGLTKEQAETVKDIIPALKLGDLTPEMRPVEVVFTEKEPRMVEMKSKIGKDKGKIFLRPVINCIDLSNKMPVSIILGSESLKREMYKLSQKHENNLLNVKARITVRQYEHEEFGDSKAYVIADIE